MKKKDKTVMWVILAVIALLILSGTIDLSETFSVSQSSIQIPTFEPIKHYIP